jgi:RNA polymerase sigma-70 factor (ECF subfamily)
MLPRLERMARYYSRVTGEDADDLLQEAWVGLFEALADVRPEIGTPEQYLLKRAKWRLLDYVKYQHRRRHDALEDWDAAEPWANESDVRLILHALEPKLTPIQRKLVRLLFSGLTWREAGARLGCTSANVAYHVRRIRMTWETLFGEGGVARR